MFINVHDTGNVLSAMDAALMEGNHWLAYQAGLFITAKNDLLFFRNEQDAEDFCISNHSDYDEFTAREIKPVYSALHEKAGHDIQRDDISYYFINGKNEISPTLKVNPDQNALLNPDGNNFTDLWIEHLENKTFGQSSFKNIIMNQDNLNYLKNNLKFTGFGEALNPELEKNINNGVAEFNLNHSAEFNNRKMEATLHFKAGDKNDMYFFNRYDAKLIKADGTEVEQTFLMDKGRGFTLKEATNLLDGRAVNKDMVNAKGEKYNAWVKLDFDNKNEYGNYETKRFHQNFGYDLGKAIEKLPIMELNDPGKKEDLLRSLQKGNLQAVTHENGERLFISADPESGKTAKLNVYDKNLKEVTTELRNVEQQSATTSEKKEEVKNGVHHEARESGTNQKESVAEKATEQKKTGKNQSTDEADDLLPKNDKKKGKNKAKPGNDDDLLGKNRVSNGAKQKVKH